MQKNVAVIQGDGIGPEVTQQSIKILDAVAQQFGHQLHYTYCLMGAAAVDKTGETLPAETIEVCLDSDAILLGVSGDSNDNNPEPVRPENGLLKLRKVLGLFANIRPVAAYPPLYHLSPLKTKQLEGVDFMIFRELTGGVYSGKKDINDGQTQALDECTYSREQIERVSHLAFTYARNRRKKLTLVDKADALETSRLWRKVVHEMSEAYSDVVVDYMFADTAAVQMLLNPRQFDVVLTENMFGDIISSEASVISGSPGLLPSASVGHSSALFEPVHSAFPQAAGKDIANPLGSILSAAMMLDHFGLREEAELVRSAVDWTLINGFVSRDIDPVNSYSTSTIGDLVRDFIENRLPSSVNRNNISLSKSTII